MNNRFKLYLMVVLLGLNVSCSDFLNKMPQDAIPETEAMTTLDDAQQIVFGLYSAFKNPGLYSGGLTLLPDLQSDLAYSIQGYSNTYGNIYGWDILTTDSDVQAVYAGLYFVISRCNFFLDNAEAVKATLTSKENKALFDKCLGDVYFARALAYSELIKMYCEAYDPAKAESQLGVSIVLEYKASSKKPLRSSLKQSYQQVLNDLALANKYIPDTRNGNDTPFFTPGVVNALYARVYLYMKNWEGAVEYSTKVIDNKVYSLSDATIPVEMYGDRVITAYDKMWIYDVGPEIIWKMSLSNTDRGNPLGQPFIYYTQVQGGRLYTPDYIPAKWVLDSYDNNDVRYQTFFTNIQTSYPHRLAWPLLIKYPGNPNIDAGQRPLFINMPKVFRLAEQYLIRAEANYHIGTAVSESAANADLTTLLRKRIMNYGTSATSGEQLFKTIKAERVKELYMEGFRLADLKRWGMGFTREPQPSTISGANALKIDKNNPLFVWPIPQHEIDAVPGMQPNPSNK